jgi:hypothetical protein
MLNFLKSPGPKYSWKKFSLILLISTTSILAAAVGGIVLRRYVARVEALQAKAPIAALLQTGPTLPLFPTHFLAEILDLSLDLPTNLHSYSLKRGIERLMETALFETVELKKIKPNLLLIDYIPRIPYLILDDATNTAVDGKGNCFPFSPFYSPKELPHLYLGKQVMWGAPIESKYLGLIQVIIDHLELSHIARIDLSKIEAPSSGQQELVVLLKNKIILRLTPKNAGKQLTHYSILCKKLLNAPEPTIIDLRLTNVAFLWKIDDGVYSDLLELRNPG